MMSENKVFVQYTNNINDVIKQPLQLTQRIKFTCFDVSSKFIVFGATSGGIYIYSIEPCHFIKLIPTKEGAVTIICISHDENIIAIATSKGFILMVENFTSENNTFYKTFIEHEGNIISTLKWHGNQLYCGDNVGKVSVTEMAKVLFQSPCISLMELDSSIIQIDCFSKFLLISTQTRTYLCDTEKEQYRQIGKKMRDGRYGACFLNNNPLNDSKSLGKTASENNALENIKIYCARPGARLWEANFDASVVYTHQFKNSLGVVPSTTIIRLDGNLESHLDLVESNKAAEKMPESFNFAQIFVFLNRYIFTYSEQGFYIFDPESVQLSYWTDHFHEIKDIKLYKNIIYIWTTNEFFVISLITVENLVIKTLIDRQYYICAELCAYYLEDLMAIVESSDKIYLLSVLREKLKVLEATDLLNKILPLLNFIKENNSKIKAQRLQSGMIVLNTHLVDNQVIDKCYERPKNDQNIINNKTFQTIKVMSSNITEKISESTKNLKEKVENLSMAVNIIAPDNNSIFENKTDESCDVKILDKSPKEEEDSMRILLEQYKINLVHESVELPVFSDILAKSTYDEVIEMFDQFSNLESHENSEEKTRNIHIWCSNQYLKLVSKNPQSIDFLNPTSKAFQYLIESFTAINFKDNLNCSCSFPLPIAYTSRIKYFTLGCAILKKLGKYRIDHVNDICLKVPVLLKYVLKELRADEDVASLLPYLLQFGDNELLSYFTIKMTYDQWDEVVKMMIKLGNNVCLNCGKTFPENMEEFVLNWTSFGSLLVKSIGGPAAVRLLKRYSKFIPSNSLDEKFYQLCIFSTVFEGMHDSLRNQAVNLATESQDDSTKGEFNELLKNFLNKKYLQAKSLNIFKNGIINIDAKCSRCSLPFNNIILEKTVRLKCGHVYHAFCKLKKPDVCEICA